MSLALSSTAQCFFPDGSVATGNYPCFLDQINSPCCSTGSICEASGLCKVAGSIGVSELVRGACTDSTWASSSCPSYCTDAATGGTNLISCQNVTQSPLDFCCDHTNGCCDSGIGRFQVPLNTDVLTLGSSGATISTSAPTSTSLARSSTTITTSSSSTNNAATTTAAPASITNSPNASTSTPPAANPSPQSGGLETGAKIGIALGVVLATLLAIAAIWFWIYRRRKVNNSIRTAGSPWSLNASELPVSEAPKELQEANGPAHFQYEMPGNGPAAVELAAERYSRGPLGRSNP